VADRDGIPSLEVDAAEFESGINVMDLFSRTSLCASKSEARRLVKQGGAIVNDRKVEDIEENITADELVDNELLLRAGKKRYFRIIIKE